ncbi:hypothetical protein DPQ22_05185 [Candidatus Tokpelaia sp.]|nr:hypothetical protein DPQ22_05185 [Candidatus Tokpelaia sp.]
MRDLLLAALLRRRHKSIYCAFAPGDSLFSIMRDNICAIRIPLYFYGAILLWILAQKSLYKLVLAL